MNAPFQFTPRAIDDLDAIWWFIAEDNRDSADRVEAEIVTTCRRLTKHPLMGISSPGRGSGPRGVPRILHVQHPQSKYAGRLQCAAAKFLPPNPTHSVRGPWHLVGKGVPAVLSSEEATALLAGMDV